MTGFVYAIGDGRGYVKIGWAKNPLRRLSELNVAAPIPYEVIGATRGEKALEKRIHAKLSQWRIRGEWFRLEGEVVEFIKTLDRVEPHKRKSILSVRLPIRNFDFDVKMGMVRPSKLSGRAQLSFTTIEKSPGTERFCFTREQLEVVANSDVIMKSGRVNLIKLKKRAEDDSKCSEGIANLLSISRLSNSGVRLDYEVHRKWPLIRASFDGEQYEELLASAKFCIANIDSGSDADAVASETIAAAE